jgi:lysozyme family protein
MARARDLLERFRPAGTPGAAARRGVPADKLSELFDELAPVLALLASDMEQAKRVREEAQAEAVERRRRAQERARSIVAAALSGAGADRADAATRLTRAAADETEAVRASGGETAGLVRRTAEGRLPAYTERVVAEVRSRLGMAPP